MKKILNFIKNTKIKTILILISLFILYITISAKSYAVAVSQDLSNAVFRLHIIANSDSDEDQQLKLKVRDALLEYMNTISIDCNNKEEAIAVAQEHEKDFQSIAESTILENGYNYSVKVNIGNFYFPTKNYGDISLPAGIYDALRIEIGEAKGQNWWCVMFPSLCFIDVSSGIVDEEAKDNLENNLEDESYEIISNNNSEMKFKFKILEFFAENELFASKK